MDNFSDMWKDVYGVRPCEWTMESYSSMDNGIMVALNVAVVLAILLWFAVYIWPNLTIF
mgnify:CR=1 FL=1